MWQRGAYTLFQSSRASAPLACGAQVLRISHLQRAWAAACPSKFDNVAEYELQRIHTKYQNDIQAAVPFPLSAPLAYSPRSRMRGPRRNNHLLLACRDALRPRRAQGNDSSPAHLPEARVLHALPPDIDGVEGFVTYRGDWWEGKEVYVKYSVFNKPPSTDLVGVRWVKGSVLECRVDDEHRKRPHLIVFTDGEAGESHAAVVHKRHFAALYAY